MQDGACRKSLCLDRHRLDSTSLTAISAKLFRIKRSTFKVVTSVSKDGVFFPTEPTAFRAEVLSQAQGLYSLRRLPTDWQDISALAHEAFTKSFHHDELCMQDHIIRSALSTAPPQSIFAFQAGLFPCEGAVSLSEWLRQLQRSASNATAFDELPRVILSALPSFAHAVLLQWLSLLRTGNFSFFLQSALHLCLQKKEPLWLIRNSRPIILEPCIRRMESAIIFQRLMSRGDLSGWIPPNSFAYRKEFSPHHLGLFIRWFLAYNTITNKQFFVWIGTRAMRSAISMVVRWHFYCIGTLTSMWVT